VVEIADHPGELKQIAGISGSRGVFDPSMLESLLWAAHHYVAPVGGLLARATPPNLPREIPSPPEVPAVEAGGHPLGELAARTAAGRRSPLTAIVAGWHDLRWLKALGPIFSSGRSVMIVTASAAETERIAAAAVVVWGDIVTHVSGEDDASDTAAWEKAQVAPRLLVGTPRVSTWQMSRLAMGIVLEESRRAMKDRQTPTLHVRDVMITRSRLETFNLVFLGPTPGVELLVAGAELVKVGNRAWPLIEVVDRSEEGPGAGYLSPRTVAAISATADLGERVFVFTHRRVGLSSTRCARCRRLRVCSNCEFRLGRVETCPKCGTPAGPCVNCGSVEFEEMGTVPDRLATEINRRLGHRIADVHPAETLVSVGTERDLAGIDGVHLAVAADVDGMLMGLAFRTSEEALRQLARLASLVRPGRGARMMIQTSHPDSALVATMRRGNPIPYLERILVQRGRDGLPPSSEMIAIEIRGARDVEADADLAALPGEVAVLGPMQLEEGQRWLLTGSLGKARLDLRQVVGRWRDRGVTVRIDADPIDV
jgi:primosomal protein N'